MNHILTAAKHAAYVYGVALVGTLAATQWDNVNISTPHALEATLGSAALGALISAVRTGAPALLGYVAGALQSAAPQPVAGLAPDATDTAA